MLFSCGNKRRIISPLHREQKAGNVFDHSLIRQRIAHLLHGRGYKASGHAWVGYYQPSPQSAQSQVLKSVGSAKIPLHKVRHGLALCQRNGAEVSTAVFECIVGTGASVSVSSCATLNLFEVARSPLISAHVRRRPDSVPDEAALGSTATLEIGSAIFLQDMFPVHNLDYKYSRQCTEGRGILMAGVEPSISDGPPQSGLDGGLGQKFRTAPSQR